MGGTGTPALANEAPGRIRPKKENTDQTRAKTRTPSPIPPLPSPPPHESALVQHEVSELQPVNQNPKEGTPEKDMFWPNKKNPPAVSMSFYQVNLRCIFRGTLNKHPNQCKEFARADARTVLLGLSATTTQVLCV